MTLLATILVLGLLIFIHELGHFLMARRVGIAVYEFALGFGPTVFQLERGLTTYSLRAVPLGGFVRMAGLNPALEDERDNALRPEQHFWRRSVAERMLVIGAGSTMNFILAVVLFAIIFMSLGLSDATLYVDEIEPTYPAHTAGVRPGDRVHAVDSEVLESWSQLVSIIHRSKGELLAVELERDGTFVHLEITPRGHPDDPQLGIIGIRPAFTVEYPGLLQALAESVLMTGQVVVGFVQGIAQLFVGARAPEVIGIIGIGQEIGQATRMGLENVLFLAAVLSANLGLINLLPIPALDGSRLVFLSIEGIWGRPVNPDRENFIHFIGFAVLIALALFVAYRDLLRLGRGGM